MKAWQLLIGMVVCMPTLQATLIDLRNDGTQEFCNNNARIVIQKYTLSINSKYFNDPAACELQTTLEDQRVSITLHYHVSSSKVSFSLDFGDYYTERPASKETLGQKLPHIVIDPCTAHIAGTYTYQNNLPWEAELHAQKYFPLPLTPTQTDLPGEIALRIEVRSS